MTRSSPFFPTLNLPPVHPHQPTIGVVGSALDVASGVLSRARLRRQAVDDRAVVRTPASLLSFAVHGLCASVFEGHSNTVGCAHADNFCPETDNADCG